MQCTQNSVKCEVDTKWCLVVSQILLWWCRDGVSILSMDVAKMWRLFLDIRIYRLIQVARIEVTSASGLSWTGLGLFNYSQCID